MFLKYLLLNKIMMFDQKNFFEKWNTYEILDT